MVILDNSELAQLEENGWSVVANCTEGVWRETQADYEKQGNDVKVIQAEVIGNVLILIRAKVA